MKYLKEYFNDDISLSEWKKYTDKYVEYLNTHKEVFDDETYHILISGNLHDAKIKKVIIDGYDTNDDIDEVFVNLKLLINIEDEIYEINYIKILNFSLNSIIEFGYGFEDVLVDECTITNTGITHELVFVGERSWHINCKKITISKCIN